MDASSKIAEVAHTPLPWRFHEVRSFPTNKDLYKPEEVDADGKVFYGYALTGSNEHGGHILPTLGMVYNFPGQTKANVELIARAVNAHETLLAAAELLQRSLVYEIKKSEGEGDDEGARLKSVTLKDVRQTIAIARGETV